MEFLLAYAHRRVPTAQRPIDALAAGGSIAEVAASSGMPPVRVQGIRSFYDQLHSPQDVRVCTGTSCHFARHVTDLPAGAGEVRCLGHCYAAPALQRAGVTHDRLGANSPSPRRSLVDSPVVLRHVLGGPRSDEATGLPDGEALLAMLESSGLRGRGGAAYPTAAKWRAAREAPGDIKYVVANGDEGDPGSYVDRLLLEEDPESILVGMLACARVVGATHGIVYIREEYPEAIRRMKAAIAAWRYRRELPVEVVSGAGSYVCGEETALLRSIEGLRGEPWPKPPYPTTSGLWDRPTVVQNVETLVTVAQLAHSGGGARSKALSISGAVREPGVVEIRLGTPLREVLERGAGGEIPGRPWKMALIGGPMGRVLPVSGFDTPLSYGALPGMGHGGIVALDDKVTPGALARHLFDFARAESCGNCTPCRVGTQRLAGCRDRDSLERLMETMSLGSLCGFGQGVPAPLRDLLTHFGDEVFST